MGLLDRVNARAEKRYGVSDYLNDYIQSAQFGFNGSQYAVPQLNQTYAQGKLQEIARTLPGYMAAARNCPPVFGAQLVRSLVLSQARFTFRNPPWHSKSPRKVFGTTALGPLERPWKNATTGELVSRMEWHAGLAGNAYVYKQPNRLRVLRPDWVAILYGSDLEPEDPMHAVDGELLGYVYANGGIGVGTPRTLLPDEVAHWSPIPDPESAGIGMSWVTPAIRDIQGDIAATDHKLQFFKNGATPNLVVKGLPNTSPQAYWDAVDALEQSHTGVKNAYRTLYLTAGADATVVGSNLQQIDFKSTQGAGETRISLLSRVPATILGISEGLAGSSLNAGNFGMARRIFADSWVYPNLQDLAAALAPLVRVPNDAELWFDTTDIPLLREDAKDAADIAAVKSQAIRTLTDGGYDPASTVATIAPDWATTLQHTGKLSVQLQEPGAQPAAAPPPKPKADPAARHLPGQRGDGVRKYNPGQPRDPGGEDGGQWTAGALKDALKLAGKIDLAPGETLVGSSKVDSDMGGIRMALTEQGGERKLRLGAGPDAYGRRIPDEGIKAWDGNSTAPPLPKAERERLAAESEALDAEYDSASPARKDAIDARLDEIRDLLSADDEGFNGTAKLDEYGMQRLAAKISPALAEAVEQEKVENAAFDELEALQAKGNADPDRIAELKQIARLERGSPGYEGLVFDEGIVPGSEWGDVHYSVELDDLDTGVFVTLGVTPKGSPDDWGDDKDWRGQFDATAARKFLRLLGQYAG